MAETGEREAPPGAANPGEREISREQARRLIEEGAQLVDVRADHEWQAGRIAGAKHLPLAELSQRAAEIDKEHPVVLYCRGGTRSTMATAALAEAGYDAAKLSEGIVGWAGDGLPLEPEGGYVAESGEAAAILQAQKKPSQS
ncbi:MAG TPA: rhodanese-like domain-containing protein [Solirubrobacterales bacterium]|jgi:rhodanese-related sulfurtransferase|nr:rhodanese-like domain-containing protein [Solirubrobacterales bacterium]